jgi:hypothetical protein
VWTVAASKDILPVLRTFNISCLNFYVSLNPLQFTFTSIYLPSNSLCEFDEAAEKQGAGVKNKHYVNMRIFCTVAETTRTRHHPLRHCLLPALSLTINL